MENIIKFLNIKYTDVSFINLILSILMLGLFFLIFMDLFKTIKQLIQISLTTEMELAKASKYQLEKTEKSEDQKSIYLLTSIFLAILIILSFTYIICASHNDLPILVKMLILFINIVITVLYKNLLLYTNLSNITSSKNFLNSLRRCKDLDSDQFKLLIDLLMGFISCIAFLNIHPLWILIFIAMNICRKIFLKFMLNFIRFEAKLRNFDLYLNHTNIENISNSIKLELSKHNIRKPLFLIKYIVVSDFMYNICDNGFTLLSTIFLISNMDEFLPIFFLALIMKLLISIIYEYKILYHDKKLSVLTIIFVGSMFIVLFILLFLFDITALSDYSKAILNFIF